MLSVYYFRIRCGFFFFCFSFFFFFKQKTAYEMRISDWSSDVCSSDLLQTLNRYVDQLSQMWQSLRAEGRPARANAGVSRPHQLCELVALRIGEGKLEPADYYKLRPYRRCPSVEAKDQKSGVEGKGVAGRVELGGRWFYKKTMKNI